MKKIAALCIAILGIAFISSDNKLMAKRSFDPREISSVSDNPPTDGDGYKNPKKKKGKKGVKKKKARKEIEPEQ
ncbi:MAG: hypothetical protein LBB25_01155 [Holosporaceae bacterium]|jgi:hypothetical protein|nr:hypothetical protein [Holosporaceae bacterium]